MELKDLIYYDWVEDTDWVGVVDVDLGGGYDWNEFHAFYSPSRRIYFYGSESGCSCDSFSSYYWSEDQWQQATSKQELMAAINRYFDSLYTKRESLRVKILYDTNAFRPSEYKSRSVSKTIVIRES